MVYWQSVYVRNEVVEVVEYRKFRSFNGIQISWIWFSLLSNPDAVWILVIKYLLRLDNENLVYLCLKIDEKRLFEQDSNDLLSRDSIGSSTSWKLFIVYTYRRSEAWNIPVAVLFQKVDPVLFWTTVVSP